MRRFLSGLAAGALFGLTVAAALSARPAAARQPAPDRPAEQPGESRDLSVRITPEMTRYSHTRYALYFVGTAVNALALLLLLRRGISARLRGLAERRGRNGLARACIYYPLFSLAYGALTLPLVFYSRYVLPHQYGLSSQTLGGWVLDGLKGFAVACLIAPPVVALLYWTMRRSPDRWWAGFWLASIPLILVSVYLGPLLLDPLFNRFQPLRDETLRRRILATAERAGIERGRVFEVDASRRTRGVNAYVTGIGGSARIVLWDTLLREMDEEEILFVMAHEMGHYAERHVPLGIALSIAGSLVLLLVVDRGGRAAAARWGPSWGVRGLDDLASFPLLLLLLLLLNFLGSPVESAVSRTFERRADTFGLRLTGDGRAAAAAFIKLSEKNLSHPDPPAFVEFWMFSHPPLKQRIDRALAWGEGARDAAPEPRP